MPKRRDRPSYRFYALYDKVYRADVLWHAYRICQFNGGAPGVDGQTFEDIEKYGRMRWLDELAEELRDEAVSPGGGSAGAYSQAGPAEPDATAWDSDDQRSCRDDGGDVGARTDLRGRLAARTIRLPPETQCAWTRCSHVHTLLNSRHWEVIDADFSGYFDSIPHSELMKSVARRISDRHMLAADQDVASGTGGRNRRAGS